MKHCLVVDDSNSIRKVARKILQDAGFRVSEAETRGDALSLCADEMPDCIVLDWQMPGRDGLDVCRTLRAEADQRLRGVPVVLLTAQAGTEKTAAGFEAGVTDYLTKPFSPPHVRTRVRAWLLRAAAARAGES